MPLDRYAGKRVQIGGRHAKRRDVAPRGDVDKIGSDGRGRRLGTGTASFQYHSADEIALGDDRIVHAFDRRDRRRTRHHARVDTLLEPLFGQPRNTEELDAIAKFLGKVDVEPRYMADSLGINPGEVDRAGKPY